MVEPHGTGRDLVAFFGTNNRMRRGLVVLVDPFAMRLPSTLDSLGAIPNLTATSALAVGAEQVWAFPADRFLTSSRPVCANVLARPDGMVIVDVPSRQDTGIILYEIEFTRSGPPRVSRVIYTDRARALIREMLTSVTDEEFDVEQTRLAGEVWFLSAEGWQPMESPEGKILSPAAGQVDRD